MPVCPHPVGFRVPSVHRARPALALLLASVLTACGGSGDGGTTGPTPGPTPPPTPAPVASITVSPATTSLVPQQATTLTATLRDASGNVLTGRTVDWSSSATGVASVSSGGLVTAVVVGSATISASSGGRTGSAIITVTPIPVALVTLSVATDTLVAGTTRTLQATVRAADSTPLSGRVVTWTSSQPAVASVDAGVVTALTPGTTMITASSEGRSASATLVVRPVPVARVVISDSALTLVAGARDTLVATPQSATGAPLARVVTWSSGNEAIATVNNGVVIAVAVGSTTVTATSDGVDATAVVTVTPVPVASLHLDLSGDTLAVGATTTLVATARDANGVVLSGRTIEWRSSATTIATVSNGVVTALTPGTATITATSEGQSASAQVLVRAPFAIADVRRSVVPGFEQTCAIAGSGTTFCWGWERYGALGNGREVDNFRTTADAVVGGPTFTSLAGGYSHTCGLTAAGAAWCWGRAQLGQIGNGTQVNANAPVLVSGGHVFTQLAAGGSDRTCGLTATGALWCWGSNSSGTLGAGAAGAGSTVPVRVAGARTYAQVAIGSTAVCALRDDGAPFCWGSNAYGQLGNGSTGGSSSVPVAVTGDHRFVELTAGFGHFCGRTAESAVWCWGFNSLGQLGDGTQVNRSSPVAASVGAGFVQIAAASVTTCGRTAAGEAFCWGSGSYGILGNGDTSIGVANRSLTPVAVQGGLSFREITSSASVFCGMTASNAVYCWGNGTYGNLGNGTRGVAGVPTAVSGLP